MNVEEVKVFILYNIHQFAGQRSFIGSVFKQRVFFCIDLMVEEYPLFENGLTGRGVYT